VCSSDLRSRTISTNDARIIEEAIVGIGRRIDKSSSILASLVMIVRERSMKRRLKIARQQLRRVDTNAQSDLLYLRPAATDDTTNTLVQLWATGSIQLHHLCIANDIRYYHFLQPSPFFGSRGWNGEERGLISPEEGHGETIETVYPLFLEQAEALVLKGVMFTDATSCFDDIPETVYSDTFGHLNQRGNNKLSAMICETIIKGSAKQKKAEAV
jgi:hypothetical protein